MSIYGDCQQYLKPILDQVLAQIKQLNDGYQQRTGAKLYEHLEGRVKSEGSMVEKLHRKGYDQTPTAALRDCKDAIGLRIVTNFIDDIYTTIALLKAQPDIAIVKEKDYITHAKPNGYRSYHMIVEKTVNYPDVEGNFPGKYFIEIQLRTIAMDTWASLEHEMKYKHDIKNPEMISKELARVADDLASCDVSMQTIRKLIREDQ